MTWTQPERYQQLLADKLANFQQLLPEAGEPQVFASSPEHYRMRAEFRIWHLHDRCFYAMFHPGNNKDPIEVVDFPVVCQPIYQLMPRLLALLNAAGEHKRKLFQIEFLASHQDILVSLIYHRPLDDDWLTWAQALEQTLNVRIIGRSRKQRLVVSHDYVDEQLTIDQRAWHYRQHENSFTQPNAGLCEQMLTWACQQFAQLDKPRDLLELYCGLGTFTLPASQYFQRVLATEISKKSVRAGQFNLELNGVTNVQIHALASEDISQALNQGLWPAKIRQENYQFDCLLVDPPRAGLDPASLELARQFPYVLYISCNPVTLADNIRALDQHRVVSAAIFDQFPYTHHLEAGVLLQRQP